MVQEKQLKELFKYIEANWDVCVSQVDKTDIKRIFGGVLCNDIMNDTLHDVKAEPIELKGNCSTFDMSRLVDQVQPAKQPKHNVLNEQFSEVHHKIVDGLGTILSSFGANSGIMSIVMSWGDTQDSVSTLEMLNGYIEKFIDKQPAEQPAMTEKEKIDHILTNKLTWKPMGNKRFYANMFSGKASDGSRQVYFVDYNNPHSGYFETRIFNIDLSEWQPVETEQPSSQAKLDNSFDKERFEAMFRAVVANGGHELCHKQAIELTEHALEQLDAYYATKEGGSNE